MQMLHDERPAVAGSFFALPRGLVQWYANAYQRELERWYSRAHTNYDQPMVYELAWQNPEQFTFFHSARWHSLFSDYLNCASRSSTHDTPKDV